MKKPIYRAVSIYVEIYYTTKKKFEVAFCGIFEIKNRFKIYKIPTFLKGKNKMITLIFDAVLGI